MSIPAQGYRYNQCSFKTEDKVKLDKVLNYVQEKLDLMKMSNYYETGSFVELDNVSFKHLYEISTEWPKLTMQMEMISYKMAVVKEFRMINRLIEESRDRANKLTEMIQLLEEELRKDYSQIITSNSFFSNYFSYKEFKNTFAIMTSAETVSISSLLELKNHKMFSIIRRQIISDKASIHSLLSENDKIIHINTIKKEDKKTYDLLRSEFFVTVCDEAFKIKIPYGKTSQTEIIRPSHPMASTLKLERTQIVYLTVSIDPIPDVALSMGSVIEFNNGMKFNVVNPQQVVEREMFYEMKLDQHSNCNLIVPFYFSFIRCNLVKEQRSSYVRINDSSMIEDVSASESKQ